MSAWIRRGEDAVRWDLYRRFGRPPVVVPPRWALYERIWESTARPPWDPRVHAVVDADWLTTLGSVPGGRSVCLVIPDCGQPGAWQSLLPGVLATLGDRFRERVLLVATGTQPPAPMEKLSAHLVGAEAALPPWRIVENSEDSFRGHVAVGRTSRGTEIRLHPAYVGADVRVLLGDVGFHGVAGFSGGPMLVFPGCGEPIATASAYANAVRDVGGARAAGAADVVGAVDGAGGVDGVGGLGAVGGVGAEPVPPFAWNGACSPGVVEGNPVLGEIEEAVALARAEWSLVPLRERSPDPGALDPSVPSSVSIRVLQGPEGTTRGLAREAFDRNHRVSFTQRPDLLIVDSGGAPRDSSLLLAQHALLSAREFVEPGGRILLVARCTGGTGTASGPGPEEIPIETLAALRSVVRSCEVALWSDLPPEDVRALGLEPILDEGGALAWSERIPGARWGWLPEAQRFLPAPGWLGGRPDGRLPGRD